jgi:hypothetical protein
MSNVEMASLHSRMPISFWQSAFPFGVFHQHFSNVEKMSTLMNVEKSVDVLPSFPLMKRLKLMTSEKQQQQLQPQPKEPVGAEPKYV